jgi:hypothetical protein
MTSRQADTPDSAPKGMQLAGAFSSTMPVAATSACREHVPCRNFIAGCEGGDARVWDHFGKQSEADIATILHPDMLLRSHDLPHHIDPGKSGFLSKASKACMSMQAPILHYWEGDYTPPHIASALSAR